MNKPRYKIAVIPGADINAGSRCTARLPEMWGIDLFSAIPDVYQYLKNRAALAFDSPPPCQVDPVSLRQETGSPGSSQENPAMGSHGVRRHSRLHRADVID